MQRISLTWLLLGTLALLFIFYAIATIVTPQIADKAHNHFNKMITIHESLEQGYAQLYSRSHSIQRLLEVNLSQDKVSIDEVIESINWLEQKAKQIVFHFNPLKEQKPLENITEKIQHLLLMNSDFEEDLTSDDNRLIEQTIKQFIQKLAFDLSQNFQQLSTKALNKELHEIINQEIIDFNTDYDITISLMESYFNQPPNYQQLVEDMLIEQSKNIAKLNTFIQKNTFKNEINFSLIQSLHKQFQFYVLQFYQFTDEQDLQSDTFILLVEKINISWEQYESALSTQINQIDEIIRNNSTSLSADIKNQGEKINQLMIAGMIIAILTLLLFFYIAFFRLNSLRLAALMIAKGNRQPLPIISKSHDIVAEIVTAFNLMIESIAKQDKEIAHYVDELDIHRQHLEEEVIHRTEELALNNTKLLAEIILRKENEDQLKLSGLALANTSDAIMIADSNRLIVEVNPAFCHLTGYTRSEVLGKNPRLLKSGKQPDSFYQSMWKNLEKNGKWDGEIINRRKSGELFPIWQLINVVYDDKGKITNYIGVFRDISERKQTEKELHNLAYYDHLTQLPNRSLFYEYLEHELTIAKRNKNKVAVLFIDLDRFKNVNDSLGHQAGDQLLIDVSQCIQKSIRDEDIAARQGGDEFMLLLRKITDIDHVAIIAENIINKIQIPFKISKSKVSIGSSIGISIYPDDGSNVEELVKHADIAMYHAKEKGRGNYQFFDEFMNKNNVERIKLEHRLSIAIEKNLFQMYYQPQINRQGKIIGAEALIRWFDEELGFVPPDKFIPIAEDNGMIHQIGKQVVEMVCQQLKQWQALNIVDFSIAINISSKQLLHPEFINKLVKKIDDYQLQHGVLELEITETAILENLQEAKAVITQLSNSGFTMALDDFGTGYSSLAYLHQLPFDCLKIDRSFVCDIPDNHNSVMLTKSIISLAQSMNMKVVAEGVENDTQQHFLWAHECDFCQGYGISRPLAVDDFEEFLLKQNKN